MAHLLMFQPHDSPSSASFLSPLQSYDNVTVCSAAETDVPDRMGSFDAVMEKKQEGTRGRVCAHLGPGT